jgi:hypothetical protein
VISEAQVFSRAQHALNTLRIYQTVQEKKWRISVSNLAKKNLLNLHSESHDKSSGIPPSRKAACGYRRVSQGNTAVSDEVSLLGEEERNLSQHGCPGCRREGCSQDSHC